MQLAKDVPVYNDVMLPSSSEKLPISLSALTTSDPTPALSKLETGAEDFPFSSASDHVPDSANTPSTSGLGSSEVKTNYTLAFFKAGIVVHFKMNASF